MAYTNVVGEPGLAGSLNGQAKLARSHLAAFLAIAAGVDTQLADPEDLRPAVDLWSSTTPKRAGCPSPSRGSTEPPPSASGTSSTRPSRPRTTTGWPRAGAERHEPSS